jgi:hypothetical protein
VDVDRDDEEKAMGTTGRLLGGRWPGGGDTEAMTRRRM